MKVVSGYFDCKPLGCYTYEFYVDDATSDEEIEKMIAERLSIEEYHSIKNSNKDIY